MNTEIDLIFGPFLMQFAHDNGVVYTSCGGDQHGVIKHLVDDLQLWGFDLVMAGNIKGYLDRYANPTTIIPEADKRDLDYKMATALTDGTKLNIEMALVANALGLSPMTPGMQGSRAAHVGDVFQLFDFPDIRSRQQPVVDYVLNAEPDGGVFAVGYTENEFQRKMLSYYKMGDGPFYLFYRPYHLCHIEAMASVAEAFLDRRSLLQPTFGFMTNVFSYAKRDLRKGEALDGVGGYTCYGLIERCPETGLHDGLPICIAENVTLRRDVTRDEPIFMDDVDYNPNSPEFVLYFKAIDESNRCQK
jgi:predicted homoserine dehydrogenase-like protein